MAGGSALVLAARWDMPMASEKAQFGAGAMPGGWVDNPNVFIHIDADGTVTIMNNRSEMGQGIRTSLVMVGADELGADWDRDKVRQAERDHSKYGNQNTDGSRSMRHWFRSVYNLPHAWAIQSFAHELSVAAGRDHRDYVLDLLGPDREIHNLTVGDGWNYGEDSDLYPIDIGRMRNVIERATGEAGWSKSLGDGRGLGLAFHHSFVSYTAIVFEVEVDDQGELTIHRADIAFDCGKQANPERIRSQLEGACRSVIS
ncbi:molybdopterin-dependent oxidoreductase [Marinobacter metalliresistant]|uniref:Molybdopterin-dependent oxidoreductase n=1 Tax=Marinobacter metalliresistant TaxID=2961995 RepID=A0ABZ2W390_9GAMM